MDHGESFLKGLFQEIQNYYLKLIHTDQVPEHHDKIEDVQVCFRIICQIVDSFLGGYHETQSHYKMLEEQLQHAEAENRKHIRIEQQLKIYAENLQEQCELMEKQMVLQQNQITSLQKQLGQLKKQMKSSSQERLLTESAQDRIQNLLVQQKVHTIPIKIKKRKTPTSDHASTNYATLNKSISQQGQYSVLERVQESSHVNVKKKKVASTLKQRSRTIHVGDQPTKPKHAKSRNQLSTSFHNDD